MKPKFFILFLFLICLAGCGDTSSNSPVDNSETSEPKWLSISLMSSGGTRSSLSYENGSPEEHEINSLILYFFDSNERSFPVTENGESFIHVTSLSSIETSNSSDNIEAIVSPSIQLNFSDSNYPSFVIAIANPTEELLSKDIKVLGDLQGIAEDFQETETIGFVMSNSIYLNSNGDKICATPITSNNIFPSEEAASKNPLNIYIERIVAKVTLEAVNFDKTLENLPVYKTDNTDGSGQDLYVKFLGWTVTSITNKSRLLKEINETWPAGLFNTDENWNNYSDFRCAWAINADEIEYKYFEFIKTDENNAGQESEDTQYIKIFDSSETSGKNHFYVNENAAKNVEGENSEEPTKILVAAQLIDANGNPADYAEYGGRKFTKDGLLNELVEDLPYYKIIETGQTSSTFQHISKNDIELAAGSSTEGPSYLVTAKLSDENETWYLNVAESLKVDNSEINDKLKSLCLKNKAKVWDKGLAYYFAEIIHSGGDDKGSVGVVRNNHYHISITGVKGIGTPVFDPDLIIIPEENQETSLTINVKMMDWKLLKQSLDIAW